MFKFLRVAGLIAGSYLVSGSVLAATQQQDVAAIKQVLQSYQQALNASDSEAVVKLYTKDGVQMAPDAPVAAGDKQIAAAYEGIFNAITLDLQFNVDEVEVFNDSRAMMRSHSAGTVKVNGIEKPAAPAAFKELWLLRKADGAWKFTHYSFSAQPVSE